MAWYIDAFGLLLISPIIFLKRKKVFPELVNTSKENYMYI